MRVGLRYPAIASTARQHAAIARRLASAQRDIDLDYTPGSLEDLDWFVEKARERGYRSDEIPEALFVLGCYAGEVLVRNLRAEWIDTARSSLRRRCAWPMVVRLPDGSDVDAIGALFRRFDIGLSEYAPGLYATAAARLRRPALR